MQFSCDMAEIRVQATRAGDDIIYRIRISDQSLMTPTTTEKAVSHTHGLLVCLPNKYNACCDATARGCAAA